MAALQRFSDQLQPADIESMLAEVKRGLTLLDIADLTSNLATRRKVTADAETIYRSIAPVLPHICASTVQEVALCQQLRLLRMRLAIAGYWSLYLPGSPGTRRFRDLLVTPGLFSIRQFGVLLVTLWRVLR
jgi:hypothetical protein